MIRRDKRYGFGRYTLRGRGLSVSIVAGRHAAGESVLDLMRDYQLTRKEVLACVEFRRRRSAAAKRGWIKRWLNT